MKWYVDRLEGAFAVLQKDSGETTRVCASVLPDGAGEGSVLEEKSGAFLPAPEEENARRKRLFKAQRALKRKTMQNRGE